MIKQSLRKYTSLSTGSIQPLQATPFRVWIRLFLRRPGRSNVGVGHKALRWDEHL